MGSSKIVRLFALAAFAAVSVSGRAAEKQPLTLAPTSPWEVDYADDSCALRRAFGTGDAAATLQFRGVSPGGRYELTIASGALSQTRGAPRIRYRADEDWFEPAAPLLLNDGDLRGVVFDDGLRPALLKPKNEAWPSWPDADRDAFEAMVTEITVAGSFERELTLQTGPMHKPMEAMRACLRELVTYWGFDSAVQETLSRQVEPIRQADWARRTLNAYPLDMLRQGKSGRVPIRVMVGADGKPTSCVASKGFAEPSFEEHACAATMRHARFEPALDAGGRPVASYFITTIVYQTR